jgi:hypothetical protein
MRFDQKLQIRAAIHVRNRHRACRISWTASTVTRPTRSTSPSKSCSLRRYVTHQCTTDHETSARGDRCRDRLSAWC